MSISFIITDDRVKTSPMRSVFYMSAPPGFARASDGRIVRDGMKDSGPEWTVQRSDAYIFKSHRAAARVANKCATAKILPILP